MKVYKITVGLLAENCYIAAAEGRGDAVVIDPGADYDRICCELRRRGLTAGAVLLTHGHFDHCNAAAQFRSAGCRVYIHETEEQMLRTDMNMAYSVGLRFNAFVPDVLVRDGDTITECGLTFGVMHTPGHTAGSVCYFSEDIIFSGDTLFYMSVGRCDMPTGSGRQLAESLRRLFATEGDYTVYPGHGEATTLAFERENNPYA